MNNSLPKKVRNLTAGLILALLTFSVGVIASLSWFTYRQPAASSLSLAPCAKPPEYASLSGSCSGVDLSAYSHLPTIPYCDLARNHRAYDGQVVRVSGVYVMAKGGSMLYGPGCQSEGATDIFLEPYFDDEEAESRLIRAGGFYLPRRAKVTMLGKFRVYGGSGFGQLSSSPFQLSLMSLEHAEPAPQDVP